MLVSYNWLKQYTNVEDNANALAEKITRGGIEVEGVEYLAEEISNVVVLSLKQITEPTRRPPLSRKPSSA